MLIKCPNCGSTAQVELMWTDGESRSVTAYREYQCGCGATFEGTFELTDIKLLGVEENG